MGATCIVVPETFVYFVLDDIAFCETDTYFVERIVLIN